MITIHIEIQPINLIFLIQNLIISKLLARLGGYCIIYYITKSQNLRETTIMLKYYIRIIIF